MMIKVVSINLNIEAAEQEGLKINKVTEIHIHADFASGLREANETYES